jgi:predicted ATP-dependent protease
MPPAELSVTDLGLTIDPASLGFSDTAELLDEPLPWIGQARAEGAARFGLAMQQRGYNLFVLGEVGSGRASLLRQAMQAAAAERPVPPDLCYLHNFDAPERPIALRLPAGGGRQFRQLLAQAVKALQEEIPRQLASQAFKDEAERIERVYKDEEARAYATLSAFAEARNFALHRDEGRLVFTLTGKSGQALTQEEVLALPKAERARIETDEQALRAEIAHYFETVRPLERRRNEALAQLRRKLVEPLLARQWQDIRAALGDVATADGRLDAYLAALTRDVLDKVELFEASDEEDGREAELDAALARWRVNLVVDNAGLAGAPVIVEDNPLFRSLFGSIEYQSENDVLVTDFSRIRAGSLLQAHGGFLMLHLRDLVTDPLVWEKLRRLLRSSRLQIEEPGTAFSPIAAVSLVPEAVDVEVKIVLVGSREQYYDLQDADPEFARHFRVKVDFADSFSTSDTTRHATAVFVAHVCKQNALPHFSAAAVARVIEATHRAVADQARQSAVFAHTEALVLESAARCRDRAACRVEAIDVEAALAERHARHDYPEQRLREAIVDGDVLIEVDGERVGRLNALSEIDLGDHRFGHPVRISAHALAGDFGLLNIEREVKLSGPIHDKGVFILHTYLASCFAAQAPLSLAASIVFEQQYDGVEGDSASCAELYALLSALSGLPLRQDIGVTGAINAHGEVLPVGAINEKIEGFFRVCEALGLTGRQGVLIPRRNRRHLMLDRRVRDAVAAGMFHIHAVDHVGQGIECLTRTPAGEADTAGRYPAGSVLGRAQRTLTRFRRAAAHARAQARNSHHA